MAASFDLRIAIVGSGTIGLSFAALHLSHKTKRIQVIIHDPRPDIEAYVKKTLPGGHFILVGAVYYHSLTPYRIFGHRRLPSAITGIRATHSITGALSSIRICGHCPGARAGKCIIQTESMA